MTLFVSRGGGCGHKWSTLQKRYKRLWRAGITVAVVTHKPEIAAFAARIVVMKDGRIASDKPRGSHAVGAGISGLDSRL